MAKKIKAAAAPKKIKAKGDPTPPAADLIPLQNPQAQQRLIVRAKDQRRKFGLTKSLCGSTARSAAGDLQSSRLHWRRSMSEAKSNYAGQEHESLRRGHEAATKEAVVEAKADKTAHQRAKDARFAVTGEPSAAPFYEDVAE